MSVRGDGVAAGGRIGRPDAMGVAAMEGAGCCGVVLIRLAEAAGEGFGVAAVMRVAGRAAGV